MSSAGLVPALRLAEGAGFYDLLDALTLQTPNASAKSARVVGGMLGGVGSNEDMDLSTAWTSTPCTATRRPRSSASTRSAAPSCAPVPLLCDPYSNRTTGSFILIDQATGVTVGAGMINSGS